jgi:CheY-like chemotaxis protein
MRELQHTQASRGRPMICRPIGGPVALNPAGTLIAGSPAIVAPMTTSIQRRFWNWTTVRANDGLEALAAIDEMPFDLVLLDLECQR